MHGPHPAGERAAGQEAGHGRLRHRVPRRPGGRRVRRRARRHRQEGTAGRQSACCAHCMARFVPLERKASGVLSRPKRASAIGCACTVSVTREWRPARGLLPAGQGVWRGGGVDERAADARRATLVRGVCHRVRGPRRCVAPRGAAVAGARRAVRAGLRRGVAVKAPPLGQQALHAGAHGARSAGLRTVARPICPPAVHSVQAGSLPGRGAGAAWKPALQPCSPVGFYRRAGVEVRGRLHTVRPDAAQGLAVQPGAAAVRAGARGAAQRRAAPGQPAPGYAAGAAAGPALRAQRGHPPLQDWAGHRLCGRCQPCLRTNRRLVAP